MLLPAALNAVFTTYTEPEELFNALLPKICEVLNTDRCFLVARNPDTRLSRNFCWRRKPEFPDVSTQTWEKEEEWEKDDPMFAAALRTEPSIFVEDIYTARPNILNQKFEQQNFGHRALVHAHLCQGGKLWGILQPCLFEHPRHWSETDRNVIAQLTEKLTPIVVDYVQSTSSQPAVLKTFMDSQFQLPPFRDRTLLEAALTHRSYVNEHPEIQTHNERLEFLGDAVLNFLSGEFLYKKFPEQPEGKLTPLRSALVDERQLAEFAKCLDLGSLMKLGRGAEQDGGRQNANLLSSTFEAIVGAYFLDTESDMAAVRVFVQPFFEDYFEQQPDPSICSVNYKSQFQAWALATIGENPTYQTIEERGPDHAKEFTAIVQVKQQIYGQGEGRRKQDAEKEAAKNALEQLGLL